MKTQKLKFALRLYDSYPLNFLPIAFLNNSDNS